jgi:hypothetical protein
LLSFWPSWVSVKPYIMYICMSYSMSKVQEEFARLNQGD